MTLVVGDTFLIVCISNQLVIFSKLRSSFCGSQMFGSQILLGVGLMPKLWMMIDAECLLSHSTCVEQPISPDLLQVQLVWVTSVRVMTARGVLTTDIGSNHLAGLSLQTCC